MASLPFAGFEDVQKKPQKHLSYEQFTEHLTEITYDEHLRVRDLDQHLPSGEANPEWIKAREGRLTGSKVADIVGLGYENISEYKKKHGVPYGKKAMSFEDIRALIEWNKTNNYQRKVLHKLLTSTFTGNRYTAWGNEHEDDCEKQFAMTHDMVENNLETFQIEHYGLCIRTDPSWMAMSPDGVIYEKFKDGSEARHLCEWKCPWPSSRGSPKFHNAKNMYGPIQVEEGGPWYPITLYYYCQIQWGMGLLQEQGILHSKTMPGHCKWCGRHVAMDINAQHVCDSLEAHRALMYCYFGVWAPRNQEKYAQDKAAFQEVTKIPFNEPFYLWMKEVAQPFWVNRYLPARYRNLYPVDTVWKARTLDDKAGLFQFLREVVWKKKKFTLHQIVDWGSGHGKMLVEARRNGFQTTVGIERERRFVTAEEASTIVADILKDDFDWTSRVDVKRPLLHFVYDGGLYPAELSAAIAERIVQAAGRQVVVCVVLSMYPANDPGRHFEAKDWGKALVGFSHCRDRMDIMETRSAEEPTMVGHVFIKKN